MKGLTASIGAEMLPELQKLTSFFNDRIGKLCKPR